MVKRGKALILSMSLKLKFKTVQGLGNFQPSFIRYVQRNGICLCLEGLWFLLRQAEIKIQDFLTWHRKAGERQTWEFSLLNSSFYSKLVFSVAEGEKKKEVQMIYPLCEWFIKFNELTKLLWRIQETQFLSLSYLGLIINTFTVRLWHAI